MAERVPNDKQAYVLTYAIATETRHPHDPWANANWFGVTPQMMEGMARRGWFEKLRGRYCMLYRITDEGREALAEAP